MIKYRFCIGYKTVLKLKKILKDKKHKKEFLLENKKH